MPAHTAAAGSELDSHNVALTARKALAYAAGIMDTSGQVFDDDRPDGIIAPPQYCVSLEWPIVNGKLSRSVVGMAPDERLRSVHASQDSIFHQPMRPGMNLTTTGTIAAIRRTRAGALTVTKLTTLDADSGAPVVTSWSSGIARNVEVVGEDISLESPPALPEAMGDVVEEVEIFIPREMPHTYTECADIWNPIHTEREVAIASGLPDIILHGTATWALAGREVIRACCGGDPARLKRLHGRFTAMVIPGTTIRVELQAPRDGIVGFTVYNDQGQAVVSNGIALVA
jgi:acyl dehydratase